jgi:hypothetical protein
MQARDLVHIRGIKRLLIPLMFTAEDFGRQTRFAITVHEKNSWRDLRNPLLDNV